MPHTTSQPSQSAGPAPEAEDQPSHHARLRNALLEAGTAVRDAMAALLVAFWDHGDRNSRPGLPHRLPPQEVRKALGRDREAFRGLIALDLVAVHRDGSCWLQPVAEPVATTEPAPELVP